MLRTYHFSFASLSRYRDRLKRFPRGLKSIRMRWSANPTKFITDNGIVPRNRPCASIRVVKIGRTGYIERGDPLAGWKDRTKKHMQRLAMMIGKYRLSGQWRQTWSVNIDADCTLADSLSLLNHSELSICPTSLNARFRIFHRDFSLEKETQYGRLCTRAQCGTGLNSRIKT